MIDKVLPIATKDVPLYKGGIISMVAIIIHNLPEWIAIFISATKSLELGLSLTIAIVLYNILEDCSC